MMPNPIFDVAAADDSSITAECAADYQKFTATLYDVPDVLREENFWAAKMADSYGSWPVEGIFELGFHSLGDYYSCLESVGPTFVGKYCHVMPFKAFFGDEENSTRQEDSRGIIKPLLPPFAGSLGEGASAQVPGLPDMHYGICVPSSCTDDDVFVAIDTLANIPRDSFQVRDCRDREHPPTLTASDIGFICLVTVFIVLTLLGSGLDRKSSNSQVQDGYLRKWLRSFSLPSNLRQLLDTETGKSGQIDCLNGIRFMSMSWVLVSHVFDASFDAPTLNYAALDQVTRPFAMRVLLNGYVCVDSFLVISGCLLGYLTFKELDKTNGRLNWIMFYLHRYLRLTGVYAVWVWFNATLFKFLAIGPKNQVDYQLLRCQDSWWHNLLYINNLFKGPMCLTQTWYLALDMQLFVLSPLFLIPMWFICRRWGAKFSLLFTTVPLTGITITIAILAVIKDWPVNPTMAYLYPDSNYYIENYYMIWTRCQPYIVGIILGFVLNRTKDKKLKLNKYFVLIMWISAFVTGFCVVYLIDANEAVFTLTPPSLTASVFFNAFHRLAWGLALAWLILACFHGYGGFINTFLCWEAFLPLSRLTYTMYLVHYPAFMVLYALFTYNIYIDAFFMTLMVFVVFSFTLLVSLLLTLLFEMPLVASEKLLMALVMKKKN